jgi:hypothetical protein
MYFAPIKLTIWLLVPVKKKLSILFV